MPEPRRFLAPLLTAGGAAIAFVAALLAYLLVHRDEATADAQTFTGAEQAAVSAAGTEAANLSSFRRAHFDADFQRALNGVTGDMITDVKRNRTTYRQVLVKGKFDLSAKVTHTALIGPVDDDKVRGYVVLVSLDGYRSTQLNLPTAHQNLRVTVVDQDGKWLVNQVENIGVDG